MQMSSQRRHFLLSYLKTLSWWTRECENSFFSANRILTLQGNIINSRMTSLTTRV